MAGKLEGKVAFIAYPMATPEELAEGTALAARAPIPAGKLTGPAEVIVLQAVPAGDPARGQL